MRPAIASLAGGSEGRIICAASRDQLRKGERDRIPFVRRYVLPRADGWP
jgi:hypothetical protein